MTNLIRPAFALALAALLAAPAHAIWPFGDTKPDGPLGAVLADVSGPVTVQKAGATSAAPAASQTALDTGDTVKTAAGGRAVIAFLDGSKMQLKDNSTFGVGKHSAKKVGVSIDIGTLQFWIAKAAQRRRYEMRTPTAVAAVRGTVGDIEVAANGETSFNLFEGSLGITDNRGNEVRLEPNQMVKSDDQTGLKDAKIEALPENKKMEEPPKTPGETAAATPPPPAEGDKKAEGDAAAEAEEGSTGTTTPSSSSPTQDITSPVSGSTP